MEKQERDEMQKMYRHSMAHVLAKALTELYPDVKLTIPYFKSSCLCLL